MSVSAYKMKTLKDKIEAPVEKKEEVKKEVVKKMKKK
jgi:hypothetical protein